jgi:hypothetical protein
MKQHLTERAIKAMVPEIDRDVLVYDEEVTGFAICVYRSGRRAFVLRYRIAGRSRHLTIGSWPDCSVTAAREEAKRLKRAVDAGNDPLGNRIDHRNAPTMSDLIDRYLREHAVQLAPRSFSDRTSLLRKLVEPEWGTRKVADITPEDVDRLLAKISKGRPRPRKHPPKPSPRRPEMKGARFGPTPVRANRVGEILRKMFNLAIRWQIRTDNPAAGFSRFPEMPRDRFLSADEIKRLAEVHRHDVQPLRRPDRPGQDGLAIVGGRRPLCRAPAALSRPAGQRAADPPRSHGRAVGERGLILSARFRPFPPAVHSAAGAVIAARNRPVRPAVNAALSKEVLMLKGWKTLAFNAGLAVLGVLQAADWVDLLGSEKAGIAITAIGIIGAVLRFVTDTPAMKSST